MPWLSLADIFQSFHRNIAVVLMSLHHWRLPQHGLWYLPEPAWLRTGACPEGCFAAGTDGPVAQVVRAHA